MKKSILLSTLVFLLIFKNLCWAQGVAVNSTGNPPDASALLDVDATGLSPQKGMLIPRMTTTQRNAISAPSESLLIFNTTTKCFESYVNSGWYALGCPAACISPPTTANAGADQNLCNVTTATLAGNTPTVGTGVWSVITGTATVTTPSSATSGVTGLVVGASATLGWTISNTPCTPSADYVIINVSAPPTTANAGSAINPACGVTTATLAGNAATVGSGTWSWVSGPVPTITSPGTYNSGVTGLTVPGTTTLRWTISNSPCTASTSDVIVTTTSCYPVVTGGTLASDATYYYRTFLANGTLGISGGSLTCDILVIGGGAGGGVAGGGGAGGFRLISSQSLSLSSYTVTIGAGGAGSVNGNNVAGNNGNNTSFSSFTASGGGGAGAVNSVPGASEGSGGGSGSGAAGSTGNSGGYSPVEGFGGGAGASYVAPYYCGGGGGAGGAGGAGGVGGGNGGIGSNSASSWLSAISSSMPSPWQTATSGGYITGGGAGGSYESGSGGTGGSGGGGNYVAGASSSGVANTGSGGGATTGGSTPGNGGSGIVIVRYTRASVGG